MLNLSIEITGAEQQLLFPGAIVVCYGERIAVMGATAKSFFPRACTAAFT
jgi:hypothetical protein